VVPDGEVVWQQDGVTSVTSDGLPLDLDGIETQIFALLETEKMEKP
jgi:hypothetical protein